jgi:hypothetical protein
MRSVIVVFASVCALAALAIPVASAEQEGCPSGFELIGVTEAGDARQVLTAQSVDAAGNNDGFVCRRALGDGIFHDFPGRPDTVYHWQDNKG